MSNLQLVLKSEWFDKIDSGEKRSEYRELKEFWNNRLKKKYKTVTFHRGYTTKVMVFLIKKIKKTARKNDLNQPAVWEIKLGKRIS